MPDGEREMREDFEQPSLVIDSRESKTPFPQGVGGKAADEYIARALKRLREREERPERSTLKGTDGA